MIVGIPKEIKNNEFRVSIIPSGVKALVEKGHKVLIEKAAGEGCGISDDEYVRAGARIIPDAEGVYKESEMIVKVKEPIAGEYRLFERGQVLFTYLHLAAAPELTRVLVERMIVGIAYETVQLDNGSLPLLIPMSEIAGKLAIQVGAHYLEKENGGSGVLMGGVPGVKPCYVTIIGGGTVGLNAAKVAVGMGACVTLIDMSLDRLRYLSDIFQDRITLLSSNPQNIEESVAKSDLVVGGVLIPGARASKLVTREMVSKMPKGSVMVDVAIDQGGCFETSRPTNFEKPVFTVDGVIHYCVTNLPSCVARTSTFSLTNVTLPYILILANLGYEEALRQNLSLRKGLNVFKGKLTNKAVAESLGLSYTPLDF